MHACILCKCNKNWKSIWKNAENNFGLIFYNSSTFVWEYIQNDFESTQNTTNVLSKLEESGSEFFHVQFRVFSENYILIALGLFIPCSK